MKPWKTNSRKTVLDEKPWLAVEHHTVELPDGRIIPNWPWIITPDYINVVAMTEDDRFLGSKTKEERVRDRSYATIKPTSLFLRPFGFKSWH